MLNRQTHLICLSDEQRYEKKKMMLNDFQYNATEFDKQYSSETRLIRNIIFNIYFTQIYFNIVPQTKLANYNY